MLFGRRVRLEFGQSGQVGRSFVTEQGSGLRISFKIEHTRSATPSKGKIIVYNAAPESIDELQRAGCVLRLFAGYDVPQMIFTGNPIANGTKAERSRGLHGIDPDKQQGKADHRMEIEAHDGGDKYAGGHVAVSYTGEIMFDRVLHDVLDAAGWTLAVPVPTSASAVRWPSGLVLAGSARDVLARLAAAAACRYWIRDGLIVFVLASAPYTSEPAPLISASNGNLIGSPTRTDKGINLKALLDPALRPGVRFQVQSRDVVGLYVCTGVTFDGDSGWDRPFYADIVALPAT